MKLSNGLKSFLKEAVKGDGYWIEKAKIDFAMNLEKQRVKAELTYAAIAQKMGTSAAYITKVFRGDSNLTIESMVKLARATGGELAIQIQQESSFKWDSVKAPVRVSGSAPSTTTTGTVVSFAEFAANHSNYNHFKEAA